MIPSSPKPPRMLTEDNDMITYKPQSDGSIRVLVDGKVAGTIRRIGTLGWQYKPRGTSYGGEYFQTLESCKRSLEGDNEELP
jgi:hypothetical protein